MLTGNIIKHETCVLKLGLQVARPGLLSQKTGTR